MNRIDRLSAILIQLQSKRVVKAQEIAERFEVSLRTVYRDVRSLEEAGVPVVGEAGVGYWLMEGYRLPPVMFTKEEATAFLMAEKLITKLTDNTTDQYFKSAMYKIKAVLKTTEKDFLEEIDGRIEIIGHPSNVETKPNNDILQVILKSISEKRILNLQYFSRNQEQNSERHIEPIGICYINTHWHLIAFCQLRNDYRDFRIDRIIELLPTSKLFRGNTHPSLQNYLKRIETQENLTSIKILIHKSMLRHIQEQKYYYGFVNQEDVDNERVAMYFLVSSLDAFVRWMLMFSDYVEIIKPDELREKLRNLIENLFKRYVAND
jgi:predicted DNA-binding transcriptional regulator YafY